MAKSNILKKRSEEDDFDFSEIIDSYDDEAVAGVMHGLIEASNNQMNFAIELTKLVINRNADKAISEDEVFSVFERASKAVSENFPLKALWDKFSTSN